MTSLRARITELMFALDPKDELGRMNVAYASNCFFGVVPPHQVSTEKIRFAGMGFDKANVPGGKQVMDDIIAELEAIGYRSASSYLTPQELRLIGGTGLWDELEADRSNAYLPAGLILGELTLPEAIKARELAQVSRFGGFPDDFYNGLTEVQGEDLLRKGYFSLEPLDEQGRTVRDPQLLDQNLDLIPNVSPKPDFPYLRSP